MVRASTILSLIILTETVTYKPQRGKQEETRMTDLAPIIPKWYTGRAKNIWKRKPFLIEKDGLIEGKGLIVDQKVRKGGQQQALKTIQITKKNKKKQGNFHPVTKRVDRDPKTVKDTKSWGRIQVCQDSGNTNEPTRKERKSKKSKEKMP